ncbi:hypothetical protein ACTFIV_008312 [Dictyostelium citrinum]
MLNKRLIDHFNDDEALSTFMGKYDNFNNYEEIKTFMINSFDHRSVFSPEDELNSIKDTNFKRFGEFIKHFLRRGPLHQKGIFDTLSLELPYLIQPSYLLLNANC